MNSEADCLTERMNSIVLRLDIDGTVLSMNGYAVNFFGVDPVRCVGMKLCSCMDGGGSTAERTIQSMLHRVIKDPDHFTSSYGVIASAGLLRYLPQQSRFAFAGHVAQLPAGVERLAADPRRHL